LTAVQENLPIKIAVYDNSKFGFIDIEQKSVGLIPCYTDLKNPNFGEVAKAIGLWGQQVSKAGELEESVRTWLAQPGPAVLDVKVKPMQLVTPPSPFVSPEAVVEMAVYTAKAMLHGKGHDVWEMMVENIP
jgi:pyruvate dehydrogenase (quinone)